MIKKIAIISDTHGLIQYIDDVFANEGNIDYLIHLGDYYSDMGLINAKYPGLKTYYIMGNHDMEWMEPKEAIFEILGVRIYATHGHLYNIKLGVNGLVKRAKEVNADIALYGHNHIQKCIYQDHVIVINPGSISEPREDNCLFSYTILEITDNEIIVKSKWGNYDSRGIGLEINTVKLVPHSDTWKEAFLKEKENLENILGNKVVQIEHVGSTSIPNMPAKPIIDIVVALDSIGSVEYAVKKLVANGYIYKGPIESTNDRYGFVKGIGNKREEHLYLTTLNSEVWYDYVLVRDYVTEHKEAFDAYLELKTTLSEKYADDRRKYTKSKFDFLEEMHRLSRKEYLGVDYKKRTSSL
ncbi:MAG: YfcE family phosphodiesterase [Clostridia bacterium]|nr:YfcE family phosphodiesterase [Clostridia bacterium]